MTDPIALKCSGCQANLDGENNSKVFFCFNCSFCFNVNVKEAKLDRYPLLYINARTPRESERVYFPFWQIESSYTFPNRETGEDASKTRLFHIPAFFIKNIDNFGDIGYYYMRKNVTPEPGNREKLDVLPAVRDIQTAALYPYIYLCKETGETAPGNRQSHPPAIEIEHRKAAMVLVPFYREGHYYFDSILSWKYPTGAVI